MQGVSVLCQLKRHINLPLRPPLVRRATFGALMQAKPYEKEPLAYPKGRRLADYESSSSSALGCGGGGYFAGCRLVAHRAAGASGYVAGIAGLARFRAHR
mmetsp:Transcript_24500/g.31372  ORF Transcript_24500/g.31372 Transcript_24500/m.31372 type:complete len:100 (+) Transcript_24500:440-739(+)